MGNKQNLSRDNKIENNFEILKKHFPSCFDRDGRFNYEKFKEEIKVDEINLSKESYGLDWLGKSYARVLTFETTRTLLKEDEDWNGKEENINSGNLLIKGDNLEVLKHLYHAYYEKIKLIYIDPPYNTGNDGFVYQDDRKFTVKELMKLAGVDEDKAKRILEFVNSKNNSHSAWLTFMYPRLYIARRLLKDDGVIFVSIDDNEVAQLRLLMDEIFGEENFVAQLPTVMNLKGNNDEYGFAGTHEFTIVYAKQKYITQLNQFSVNVDELDDWQEDEKGFYKQGANLKATGVNAPREKRPNLYFPIFIDDNNNIYVNDDDQPPKHYVGNLITLYPITNSKEMSWRWSKDKFIKNKEDIIISRNGGIGIYKKQRPALGDLPSKKPKTIFYKPEYSSGNGTVRIKELFIEKVFSNPKPYQLIKDFLKIGSNSTDFILDFFAGSGTTGDAVMQLNAEDGGNRKFILVQLPEPIDEKKNKTAYEFVKNELGVNEPTIFDICKERLIRASKKIAEETIKTKIAEKQKEIKELEGKLDLENKEEKIKQLKAEINSLKNQDLGFKIFETTPVWDDYLLDDKELTENTKIFNRILFEDDIKALLTTWKTYDGIPLIEKYEEINLSDYTAYYCKNNLYLLNNGWNTKYIQSLLEKIDAEDDFVVNKIIIFGYHFESKHLREIEENIRNYSNKKQIEIETILRF
ncbi:MAG: adenine-specific DNA-methyltransferase [Deferribacteres bacterium]|jgi:adenine-specific DNA-methyltransferase|nr:adenine-specific DNA-methyltransferase [Deferribacteres bacterium]